MNFTKLAITAFSLLSQDANYSAPQQRGNKLNKINPLNRKDHYCPTRYIDVDICDYAGFEYQLKCKSKNNNDQYILIGTMATYGTTGLNITLPYLCPNTRIFCLEEAPEAVKKKECILYDVSGQKFPFFDMRFECREESSFSS